MYALSLSVPIWGLDIKCRIIQLLHKFEQNNGYGLGMVLEHLHSLLFFLLKLKIHSTPLLKPIRNWILLKSREPHSSSNFKMLFLPSEIYNNAINVTEIFA